jgi:hypothetical protein
MIILIILQYKNNINLINILIKKKDRETRGRDKMLEK